MQGNYLKMSCPSLISNGLLCLLALAGSDLQSILGRVEEEGEEEEEGERQGDTRLYLRRGKEETLARSGLH